VNRIDFLSAEAIGVGFIVPVEPLYKL